jgi:hypothetical protein
MNKRSLILLGLGASLSFAAFAQTSAISFNMMHTVPLTSTSSSGAPLCQHPGFQPTYCDGAVDMKKLDAAAGMTAEINKQIDRAIANPKSARLYVAYFSFSNKGVQAKLCEAGKAGVQIEAYIDNGSLTPELQNLRTSCQANASAPNLRLNVLGGMTSSPWRLHHNKTLVVDPGNGDYVNVNFSSGNLSAFGTSLHHDHWGMLRAPQNSNLVKAHKCVFAGLAAADAEAKKVGMYSGGVKSQFDGQVAGAYIRGRDNCYKAGNIPVMGEPNGIEAALANPLERVAPIFSPNENDEVLNTFVREIGKVTQRAKNHQELPHGKRGYIYIAVQHFLNWKIAAALQQASKAGVDVRIIFDDDLPSNSGEVEGVAEFMNSELKPHGIKLRFIETNHNAGGNGQMMHNKFCILSNIDNPKLTRTFSGAGQYTGAAMHGNWENFYLAQAPEFSKLYGRYFEKLWNVSVDENRALNAPNAPIAPPEGFAPQFQQMLNM